MAGLMACGGRPPAPPPAPATTAARQFELVWADEFDRDGRPDSTKWTYEHGFVRNEELQWYRPENARVEHGQLIIEARASGFPIRRLTRRSMTGGRAGRTRRTRRRA